METHKTQLCFREASCKDKLFSANRTDKELLIGQLGDFAQVQEEK